MKNLKSFRVFESAFEPSIRHLDIELNKFTEVTHGGGVERLFVKKDVASEYEGTLSAISTARSNNDTVLSVDGDELFIMDNEDCLRGSNLEGLLGQFNRKFGANASRVIYYDSNQKRSYL